MAAKGTVPTNPRRVAALRLTGNQTSDPRHRRHRWRPASLCLRASSGSRGSARRWARAQQPRFYKDHFAKYGPIFKTRLFGFNFVVVSGHEAFHQFATDPRIERGGTDPISVEQMFFKSLALVDGQEHRSRKDVMLHAVRTARR